MKSKGAWLALAIILLVPLSSGAQDATPDIDKIRTNAENGAADAEFQLGEAYHKGEGVPQDDMAAFEWYQKSANQGNTDAEMALGFIYRGGSGLPMDKIQSYMWFALAAAAGNDRAFELRNDVSWSMTESEINEAKKRMGTFKPKPENPQQ